MALLSAILGILLLAAGTLLALVMVGVMQLPGRSDRAAVALQAALALVALGLALQGEPRPAWQAFTVLLFAAALSWLLLAALPRVEADSSLGRFARTCLLFGNAGLPPFPGFWGRALLVLAALQQGGVTGAFAAVVAAALIVPAAMGAARVTQGRYRSPAAGASAASALAVSLLVLYLLTGLLPGPLLDLALLLSSGLGSRPAG